MAVKQLTPRLFSYAFEFAHPRSPFPPSFTVRNYTRKRTHLLRRLTPKCLTHTITHTVNTYTRIRISLLHSLPLRIRGINLFHFQNARAASPSLIYKRIRPNQCGRMRHRVHYNQATKTLSYK